MEWLPQPEPLAQLAGVLRDSLSGHDVQAQRNAEQMIKQAKLSPDVNNYLTWITTHPTADIPLDSSAYQSARHAAAILLKNNIKSYSAISEISKTYIKAHIIEGLRDASNVIRNYTGNVIAEIVKQGGLRDWPQVLPQLISIVEGPSEDARDGALNAITKICEDNTRALDKDTETQRPLAFLLPKLLSFTEHVDGKARSRAITAINVFLNPPMALTIKENIDAVLSRLVIAASDSSEDVRRGVCRSFALLADGMPAALQPHIAGIVAFTLVQQKSSNADLQLDAAEFFWEASTKKNLVGLLSPMLPQIVPVLLDCMVYSEEDQLRLEGDDDDEDQDDNEQDIKPQFASSRRGNQNTVQEYAYDELSDGEIEEEEDDYDADPEDEWNLRKCSAAALDSLALHFGDPVFELTLPWLTANLQSREWPYREAAILALGAIGPGAIIAVSPHLPQLIPYIIAQLNDEQPVMRRIACWALSRFAAWAAKLDDNGKRVFFEPMMDGILNRMLDSNKKVQASATSAFALVEDAAGVEIAPYCEVIVQQFVKCFAKYKDRNIYVLYDCVQTLASHAAEKLSQPDLVQLLMPALITRWQKVSDTSRELFPLLECISFVVTALKGQFMPYAQPFFDRCIKLIHENLTESMTAASNPYLEEPDKDFLVTSLDLLSAMVQSLPLAATKTLVMTSPMNVFELMAYCMRDSNNDVKQSAYALLGDCAIYIFSQLQTYVPTIIELVITELDINQRSDDRESLYRVTNNACWSGGEIIMRSEPAVIAQYSDRLLQRLVDILFSTQTPSSLKENAAIALGRLGIPCHQQMAPQLARIAPAFLHCMHQMSWTDEKATAFYGFAQIVLDNPPALEKCLLDMFVEIAGSPKLLFDSMPQFRPDSKFQTILQTYKSMIGNDFDSFLSNLPATEVHNLKALYSF